MWKLCVGMLIIILLGVGLATLQATNNEQVWNGGYCECGTHWELKGVDKAKNGSTTKYYACENCYKEIVIKY